MMNAQYVLKVHNETFYGALLSGDLDKLSALYSDDYRLVRSDGSILNNVRDYFTTVQDWLATRIRGFQPAPIVPPPL